MLNIIRLYITITKYHNYYNNLGFAALELVKSEKVHCFPGGGAVTLFSNLPTAWTTLTNNDIILFKAHHAIKYIKSHIYSK